MANHNLFTFLRGESAAIGFYPNSATKVALDILDVDKYMKYEGAKQASNGSIVLNPNASANYVMVIVFADNQEDKTIGSRATSALFEIHEAARLKEIAELEARLAELRAKG